MVIGGGNDIILEVLNARNPARYAKALEKLDGGAVSAPEMTASTTSARAAFQRQLEVLNQSAVQGQGITQPGSKAEQAFRQLEQLTLQKALEVMIPDSIIAGKKNSAGGQYWKSNMAQVLAKSLSDTNKVGIAASLHKAFLQAQKAEG